MTVSEWIKEAEARLASAGVSAPKMEAQLLAGHVLLVDRPWLVAHANDEFPDLAGETLLVRRLGHEPLAYILGYREFFGHRFKVSPSVLIPRHETEVLVEAAIERIKPGASVLDLGTGSGCIAISLKLARTDLAVTACDLSQDALEVARANANVLGAEVEMVQSDGFGAFANRRFDALVTNPPYIGAGDPLPEEIAAFEPATALFAGLDGLDFYRRLAAEAPTYLGRGSLLLAEVGDGQATDANELFTRSGFDVDQPIVDLLGHRRVVVARKG